MSKIKSVLFVCTGNTCRSAMAEGLLKRYLKDLGKDNIETSSAGIMAYGGLPPTDEAIEVTKSAGVDISTHKTRNMTADLIRKADLVLVMEWVHKEAVLNLVPEADSKTYLVKEFGRADIAAVMEDAEIRDPIGMPEAKYKECLEILKAETARIAKIL